MITDVFIKRYPDECRFFRRVPGEVATFLSQGALIASEDLFPFLASPAHVCKKVSAKICRELGASPPSNSSDVVADCIGALFETYSVMNGRHGTPQEFALLRMSLLELLFREIEEDFSSNLTVSGSIYRIIRKDKSKDIDRRQEVLLQAVSELNHRLREARLPFHYHNGIFQKSSGQITEEQIERPFWEILRDVKWRNVDTDIKEAIDSFDQNGRDVALYAAKALESTIKVISGEKGWTNGRERGAANYIDNLVSSSNGRFIEPWEADQLKKFFSDIRNPHGHGPGSAPLPVLSTQQERWVIEFAMIWIKSLVTRM